MNILLKWDKGYEEAMVVATTLNNPNRADELYGQRFGIEAMHKDWKSNAFELEKTRVTDPNRIEMLLIPIAFAYTLGVLEGEKREGIGDVRSPPKGKTRMTGLFLNGLRSISNHIRRATLETFVVFIRNLLQPFNDCVEDPGVRISSGITGDLRKGGSFAGWMSVISRI